LFAFLACAAVEAHADASFPPPLYPDASNAAQPAAAQNLGIGLGSALAPGATALAAGGSGYAIGDTLTLQCAGCTFTTSPMIAVTSVAGGAINGWIVTRPGVATRLPANTPAPALTQSATSGAGSGASFTGAFAPLAAGLSVPSLSNTGGNATNGNLFLTAESPDPGLAGAENTFGGEAPAVISPAPAPPTPPSATTPAASAAPPRFSAITTPVSATMPGATSTAAAGCR
jgi:hypothetical protein